MWLVFSAPNVRGSHMWCPVTWVSVADLNKPHGGYLGWLPVVALASNAAVSVGFRLLSPSHSQWGLGFLRTQVLPRLDLPLK